MEFKDYKEKQRYYENRANQEKVFFDSGVSGRDRTAQGIMKAKFGRIIKGRTYIKPKEDK